MLVDDVVRLVTTPEERGETCEAVMEPARAWRALWSAPTALALVAALLLSLSVCLSVGCSKVMRAGDSGIKGSAEREGSHFSPTRVPGARVEVVDSETHAVLASTATDEHGDFEMAIAPGHYLVVWRGSCSPGGYGSGRYDDPYLGSVAHAEVTVAEGEFTSIELVQVIK